MMLVATVFSRMAPPCLAEDSFCYDSRVLCIEVCILRMDHHHDLSKSLLRSLLHIVSYDSCSGLGVVDNPSCPESGQRIRVALVSCAVATMPDGGNYALRFPL